MGQRLNIEFIYDDKVIASAYYHWSGYTVISLLELARIHKAIKYGNIHDKKSAILELVDVFDNKLHEDSGVLGDSVSEVRKYRPTYEAKDNINRNYGLLAVVKNDINTSREYEEFRINYDLKNRVIVGNTLIFEETEEDILFYASEPKNINDSDVKYVDFETFNIDNIAELIHFYHNHDIFKYKDKYYRIVD